MLIFTGQITKINQCVLQVKGLVIILFQIQRVELRYKHTSEIGEAQQTKNCR